MILNRTFKFLAFAMTLGLYSCGENNTPSEPLDIAEIDIHQSVVTQEYSQVKKGSVLHWSASHLGGLEPRIGKIYCKSARVISSDGELTTADISMDMSNMSVDNLEEESALELVSHLQSNDFFDVPNYPISTFELARIEPISGDFNSKITGNLSILGVRKSISFKANIEVTPEQVSVHSEEFTIDRDDWGMTYNAEGTAGV
ncbi:MAG: YceI family protein, partial [Flavobacteriales bacterium]